MTERVLGPTGSPRRRWTLLLPFVAVLALGLFYVAGAQAVHDEVFELDGNVIVDAGGSQNIDWASLFDADGDEITPLPAGFDATSFKKDFNTTANGGFATNDSSTYATGSKDTLPIGTGWQCNVDNNVNSKIDVINAYAASYTDPTGDEILYFGLERNTNTGDANVAFWFLQSNVGCTSSGGATNFTGGHQDGDLLVVSAFSNGGTVSTINVYEWVGNDATGSLNTVPVASGVDCRAVTTPPDDEACAAANQSSITTPWLTAAKTLNPDVGHTLPTAQFFEGGVNLTDSNLGGKCFNSFLGDTRSSTSLTATLFDFAGGQLGQCTSTTVTTPNITTPTTIPANGTLSVSDSAVITVTGASSFSGSLSFHLCGPSATQTLCTSGGVAVGSPQTITANGTYASATATVTSVGHYCWRADFSGDSSAGVPPSSDSRANECFQVTPRTPTLSTQAVNAAGNPISAPVSLGTAIYDRATLGNTANKKGSGGPAGSTDGSINPATAGTAATGTINFKLYGPSPDNSPTETECNTLASGFPAAGITVNVTNGNGTYGGPGSTPPVTFTPTSPGFYFWKATFTSDDANTNGASHNGNCSDSNEMVEVLQLQPAISTEQSFVPNDAATITVASGAGDLAGSVVFKLYVDDATCTDPPDYTSGSINITTGTGTGLSRTVVSNNTTSYKVSGTTFHWKVEYTNTNPGHKNVTSACGIEHSSIVIDNDGP